MRHGGRRTEGYYGSGTTMMLRFKKVPVFADTLNFAVNVFEPGVSPVTTNVALPWRTSEAADLYISAWASDAATVVLPDTANAMNVSLLLFEFESLAVRVTSTFPDAGTVTVAD
jgi:hypothetical protein